MKERQKKGPKELREVFKIMSVLATHGLTEKQAKQQMLVSAKGLCFTNASRLNVLL